MAGYTLTYYDFRTKTSRFHEPPVWFATQAEAELFREAHYCRVEGWNVTPV